MNVPASNPEEPGRRNRPSWLVVVIGVAALILAALVISQVASPLAGLISPADPPFFAPATLVEHRNPQYGVDEWVFASELSGCEVYAWYEARATYCRPDPLNSCEDAQSSPLQSGTYSVGYCQGHVPFGEFTSDWEIYISDGYNGPDGRTRYLIAREVNWLPSTP